MVRRSFPLAGLVALGMLVLAGCSSSAPTGGDVQPIEDILATEITVAPDPSGAFAVLEVDTEVPVACSVVYGTSEAFGLIATDDDMAGGAHREHQPRLQGLQPDTTYQYRLQGTDAAGTLYQSEVMAFTTPPADQPDRPGQNAAVDATVVDVSSEFSADFAAENAIDGDLATEWSTDGDGDDASITIDLGEPTSVVGLGFRTRQMSDGTAVVEQYRVTVDEGATLGPFEAGGPGLATSAVEFEGQVLRFDATRTTGGNTGAVEVEVYTDD